MYSIFIGNFDLEAQDNLFTVVLDIIQFDPTAGPRPPWLAWLALRKGLKDYLKNLKRSSSAHSYGKNKRLKCEVNQL